MMNPRVLRVLLVVCMLAATACDISPQLGPCEPRGQVARIKIFPTSLQMKPGEVRYTRVDLLLADGSPYGCYSDITLGQTWGSYDFQVADVVYPGTITARNPGATWVKVMMSSFADSIRVTVSQ